jgi:AcrR family transcriptional regulator
MSSVEKAEQDRELICQTLVTLIEEQGYAKTSLDDLLTRAGIDQSTFERSFQTLDECFAEVWTEFAQALAGPVLTVYADAGNWRRHPRPGLDALSDDGRG